MDFFEYLRRPRSITEQASDALNEHIHKKVDDGRTD